MGTGDLTNSVRAAYIPDPFLRERLIPLLNKGFFMDVLQRMRDSGLGTDLENNHYERLKWEYNYRFLEANQFFGNELLAMPAELPVEERKIVAALGYMICDFIDGWDNFEEMLTIIGFAPIRLIDGMYLIADRQNENVQSIREQNRFRLTHACSFLLSCFKTRENDFLQIFSEEMQRHNLYVYRSQSEMPQTPSEIYLSTPEITFGHGPTTTSVNECLQYYLSECVRFKAVPRSEAFCYVGDIAMYGVSIGAKITPETLKLCIKKCAWPDSVIDNFLQGFADKRSEIMQLVEQFPDERFVQAVLNYSGKNTINLYELPEFVASIDKEIAECTKSSAVAKTLWPILSYAADHALIIPQLHANFQRVLEYFIDSRSSVGVAALLKYATKHNLQVGNIEDLIQKSYAAVRKGYPAVFINFCRYSIDKIPNVALLLKQFVSCALPTSVVYEILADAGALRIDSATATW
ncbi:MAG: hypothetical protein LBC04_00405 [Holosporaceae bacterium]|jgi:hypothetical protein|nr:hypothetical protein [Holosporaceae bacterium]